MNAAAIPDDEPARLSLLTSCSVLDTPDEAAFDSVARLAAELCGTPIALVTLVDEERQWFKARVGITVTETPRKVSMCAHAILSADPLVVPDTLADARFRGNPLVTAEPALRFYAGIPLKVRDDTSALGTLCVADYVPRTLSEGQLSGLRVLAKQVATELRMRHELQTLHARLLPAGELPVGRGDVVEDRWRLDRMIGKGGLGSVFLARDEEGQRVAIKFLLPRWSAERAVVDRFVAEARVLARLDHPHIARILDAGNLPRAQGAVPFIVMEYLEGSDLHTISAARGARPWTEGADEVMQACLGLHAAHEAGIVHRDVKPSNLFAVPRSPGGSLIKVIDFGIAKDTSIAPLTAATDVIGSMEYMAPEQMLSANDVDARADVWSLGVVLYELVTGELPFPGRSQMEVCLAAMQHAHPPVREHVPELPAALDELISACLQKQRDARPATANELAISLRALTDRGR